ncbi:hypothetical protein [Aureicoccus marinus]|uniref:hypothetical protein n=1 Tax=Aureicoccus marinus TaxID=754435 RepID=UPI0015E4418F|nr:hypothetical protein [Aureicoccus marinus]
MPQFTDRSEFPGLEGGVYANTPACGLISKTLVEWRREQDQVFLKGGAQVFMKQQAILSETRKSLRRYLGVQNERALALVPNFSWGFNASWKDSLRSKRFCVWRGNTLLYCGRFKSVVIR